MGTMRTFDPETWTPRELVAPNGQRWTPSSRGEEAELVGTRGYRYADRTAGEGNAEPVAADPADTDAGQPLATEPTAATEPVADGTSQVEEETVVAEPAPPKPKRRRTPTAEPAAEPVDAAAPESTVETTPEETQS